MVVMSAARQGDALARGPDGDKLESVPLSSATNTSMSLKQQSAVSFISPAMIADGGLRYGQAEAQPKAEPCALE